MKITLKKENLDNLKLELKGLLISDISALTKRLTHLLKEESSYYDDFIIVNGRLKQIEKEELRNTVSKTEIDLKLNKIRSNFISIINSIRLNDIKLSNKNTQFTRKLSIVQLENHKFKNLEKRYFAIKDWLEQNGKEFNFNFSENKIVKESNESEKISSESKQTDLIIKIFGSNLKIDYSIDIAERIRHKYNGKEEFYTRRCKRVERYIFNIEKIYEITIRNDSNDNNTKNLSTILFKTKDGLNNVWTSTYFEYDRISKDASDTSWDLLDEGNIDDGYTNFVILFCLNEKFLNAFLKKSLEFKDLCSSLTGI